MMAHWKWILLGLVGVVSAGVWAAENAGKPVAPDNLDLYLLIGQSNMAGRGKVEPQDQQADPRIFVLDSSNEWKPAVEPLHFDKQQAGVGPGRSFGAVMAQASPGRNIGLVPCAVGGTSIRVSVPGGYDKATQTYPYDDMLKRVRIAMQAGTLKGILWHQGESDSSMGLAGTYYPAIKTLIERLRKELNAAGVPFVIGQLGQFAGAPWDAGRRGVDTAHRMLAAQMPYCGFVSSEGLAAMEDGIHFDAAGARELGKRFAAEMIRIQTRATPWELPEFEQLKPQADLPDVMTMRDGTAVKDAGQWMAKRRDELKKLICHYEYGYMPPRPLAWVTKRECYDPNFLGGKAIIKQVVVGSQESAVPPIRLLMAVPKKNKGRCPVILALSFTETYTLTEYSGLPLPAEVNPQEAKRGSWASRWPLEKAIDRGYAVATFYVGDVQPDKAEASTGVRNNFRFGEATDAYEWGTIAAWAWGLSRAVDYLVEDAEVDGRQIIVMGHSRNGKAALLAGAMDERMTMVISNQSGCCGAALHRGKQGETIQKINTSFPHWFSGAFKQFNDKEAYLPFDQHAVIALIAPRPVLVCSAQEDQWADPNNEFASLKAAWPVYTLLTGYQFKTEQMPEVNVLTDGPAAYHIRLGKHDVTEADWEVFMNFADRFIKP
ncbi:MAG: sialate O-acetylesterase [Anaerohalosphaeraceae bacterium]